MQRALVCATFLSLFSLSGTPVHAQVGAGGYSLPLSLATQAAAEAIKVCEGNGYAVSAVVVDPSGVIKVEEKGDRSTIHTSTSAFRKAYTVVTMGPIFSLSTSSAFANLVTKNPGGAAFSTLPDILPLPGAVAIKAGDEIVGALGVSGSPGGDKDELCAQAGVAKIRDSVSATQPARS